MKYPMGSIMFLPETEYINIQEASTEHSGTPKGSPKTLPAVLPILGLSDAVVFPGDVIPLLVETPSSVRLIDDVVAGDRFLGLVLQKDSALLSPGPGDFWDVGCLARVLKMQKAFDNTTKIMIEGLRRIYITQFVDTSPYLKAQIQYAPPPNIQTEVPSSVAVLVRQIREAFEEIIELAPNLSDEVKAMTSNTNSPDQLADLIASNINLSLEERQEVLNRVDVQDRLQFLYPLLKREHEFLSVGSKIQHEVAAAMSKNQRDFFLREQMRAIQKELGETDPQIREHHEWTRKINDRNLPESLQTIALQELERLQYIPPASSEYTVARNYLDWIVSLPWSHSIDNTVDLDQARAILDKHHYGLEKVKNRLLEFLAVIKLKNSLKGPILCLLGPPGVGKTSLGESIALALGRGFARIALGGLNDEAEIRGHRRTYVAAMPGRIIQALRRLESNNPVILLDEIDKISSDVRGDPAAALLEVLDSSQNHTFTDHYLDHPFDLSKVLFLTTANWLDPIHPALRDRLEIIELPSYTETEKLQIARRHLIPRQLKEHGIKRSWVKLPPATITSLIQNYSREAGVRHLEREIASLARKAARQIASTPQLAPDQPIVFTPESLREHLGPNRFSEETVFKTKECGMATALAWTSTGGEILFIEASQMPGKGELLLTGSLGKVMKESAQTALSYLRGQSWMPESFVKHFDQIDIHIHVPAGATPKDGPSAGVAILIALVSLLTQQPVTPLLGMTGEISLRGRVLPIGGVKEKVLAAARVGLKSVILPKLNEPDWSEIPKEISNKLSVHYVEHVSELFPLTLTK